MAVNDKKPTESVQMNQFWPRHRHATVVSAFVLQLIVVLVAIGLVMALNLSASIGVWVVVGVVCLIGLSAMIVSLLFAMRPLKFLLGALVYISGERSAVSPPNLNDTYFAKSQLRPLLQLVYDMASGQTATTTDEPGAPMINIATQLNHTSTGVIMLNSAGEIIFSNTSAPVFVDAKGKKSLELIFDVDQSIAQWLTERGDHDIHAEKVWRRIANKLTGEPDRRLFDVHVSYEKGSEAETIITLFDRTNDYQPEDDDLDFIAFAAHELRGPITVIRGYLDALNDELSSLTDPGQRELFSRLIVSANRLSGYVNNILNASRFDRRHLKIHLEEQHLQDVYDTIADDMQLRAEAQRRLLSVDFPPTLPTVATDPNSMGEVLGNLIDNAIKYSNDGGSIEVTAAVNGDFVEVSVADHGIGMPANVIGNLFHKFYRSHRSRETVAGTGIGLYITKAIVESNGGKISVRSVEGHGSTFTVSLPIYSTVADKLRQDGVNNQEFIERSSSGWIKNHGAFRG